MKCSEFLRMLAAAGVRFRKGRGSHRKAYYKGRQTVVPDHGAKEIGEGLRRHILKELGIKP